MEATEIRIKPEVEYRKAGYRDWRGVEMLAALCMLEGCDEFAMSWRFFCYEHSDLGLCTRCRFLDAGKTGGLCGNCQFDDVMPKSTGSLGQDWFQERG